MNLRDIAKIFIVARYTFIEIYKSKIMMSTALLGIALVIITYVAAEFTYGVPAKVALDFGLGILTLSSAGIAIFMGSNLISKEIESRTVYMVLSRPIRRYSFMIGRVLGMIGILLLNILILGFLTLVCFKFYNGDISPLIYWCIGFIFIEAIIVLLIVILFSLITNMTMAIIYSLAIYILGHALGNIFEISRVKNNPALKGFIEAYSTIFPDLSKLNLKDYVIYNQTLEWNYLLNSLSYGVVYSLAILLICSFIFEQKNLD